MNKKSELKNDHEIKEDYDENDDDSESAESSVNDVEETVVVNESNEAHEVEKLIAERYDGNLPQVGIGFQHYMEKISEIEQKAKMGYYDFEVQMNKKKKKYLFYKRKLEERIKRIQDDNDPKKQKYLRLVQVFDDKLAKLQKKNENKLNKIKNS
jgi:hypothetical protein